jgi:uncharacterized protein (DUF927 family)
MAKKIEQAPSTQISVIAEGKDELGRRYFLFGAEGEPIPNLPPVLASRLIKDRNAVLGELVDAGFGLFTDPEVKVFRGSLQKWGKKNPSFRVATKIGWSGLTYVLPDKIFNPQRNVYPVLEDLNPETIAKYRVSRNDSLQDWQEDIGKLCLGNSRLMFAVALAFTGPILQFVRGVRSGGFQIYGDAETGKSTAAMVAGSAWGCHRLPDMGFLETWNTTDNAVELAALGHNDGLLILDETKKAGDWDAERAKAVINVTMRLAEQREKRRLTATSAYRSWRGYFLSTSNFSLKEMAVKGGVEIDNAVRGRLVDIPLPRAAHGIYEDLHGLSTGSELTDLLKTRCRIYYGVPIREFLEKLLLGLRRGRVGALKTGLQRLRKQYLRELDRQLGSVERGRAPHRFATVYAAGALAISLKVLDWDRNALRKAILSCQLDGLKEATDTEEAKPVSAVNKTSMQEMHKKLMNYLIENKANSMNLRRGAYADPKKHKFGSVSYYFATHKGRKYCYLTADALKSIIGSGPDAKRFKQSLVDRGLLDVSSGGAGGRRFVVERRIFTGKRKEGMEWVHAIRGRSVKTSA